MRRPLCLEYSANPRNSRGYFFLPFFAAFFAFFFATVCRSPPLWTSGARGALLYASSSVTAFRLRGDPAGYRALAGGCGDFKKILARKVLFCEDFPSLIIGNLTRKIHERYVGGTNSNLEQRERRTTTWSNYPKHLRANLVRASIDSSASPARGRTHSGFLKRVHMREAKRVVQ